MSFHPIDLKLPEGVVWYDLCPHRQRQTMEHLRHAKSEPFVYCGQIRIEDLKCEACR